MHRPKILVAVLSLVAVLFTPAVAATASIHDAPGRLQAPERSAYVNPLPNTPPAQPVDPDDPDSPLTEPGPVPSKTQPDHAVELANGVRIEVYTSAGGADVPQDWRTNNAFSYLVATAPANTHVRATVFNTLHDGDKAVRSGTGWKINTSISTRAPFTPATAFLVLLNKYSSDAQRKNYVHILGDKRNINKALKEGSGLASLLTQATDYRSCSKSKTGACLTTEANSIMHSKYATFEQANDSTGTLRDNVVWVTSSNLNGSSGGKKSNTSIAIFGDKKLHDDTVRLFNGQIAQSSAGISSLLRNGIVGNTPGLTLYPSPRTGNTDFESNYLEAISNARLGSNKTDCKVWVVHSLFSRLALRDGLHQLYKEGCQVKVVLGFRALADVTTYYFDMGAQMRELIKTVEFSDAHDKSLAAVYKLNGVEHGVGFGGSANFNTTSLTHDELAFRVDNREIADAMGRHGDRLYLLGKGTEKNKPVTGVTLTPANPRVRIGDTLKMKAKLAPANASVRTVIWSSSDSTVASVDVNGRIRAHQPGVAEITATSVSAGIESKVTVTVPDAGDPGSTSSPDLSPDPVLSITNPPELTMRPYQPYGGTTTAVVTWSQGDVNLNGQVQLQYSSKGKWKNYRLINVVNGRGQATFSVKAGKGWRVVARTANYANANGMNAKMSKASLVGEKVIPQVSQSKPSTAAPRLYGPTLVTAKTNVPYRLSWRNPSGKASVATIQYRAGKKWKNASQIVVPAGRVVYDFGYPSVKSRKWRVVVGGKATNAVMVYTQK